MVSCASSYSNTNWKVLVCLSHTATGTLHSRSLTPDDDVFQYLANTYASRNPNMKGDQCKSKMNFPNGVTNGYSWYPLKGELLFISTILLLACTQRWQLVFVDPGSCQKCIGHCAVPSIVSLSANITRTAGAADRLREAQTCASQPRLPSFTQMLVQHFPTTSQDCAKNNEQDTDLNPKFNREERCANKSFWWQYN